jgi:SAM-dependent methyltransferase
LRISTQTSRTYEINIAMKDPHQDITSQIYNSWAEEYKKSSEVFIFPGNMFEIFLEELSWKKVVDVGCAYWRDVQRLRNLWFEAYGIDISQELIRISHPDITQFLQVWDICNLTSFYDVQTCDGVLSSATLLHIDKEIACDIMKQIYDLLNDNWVFFCTLKISESWETLFKESLSLPWIHKKYVYYRQNEIIHILENIWFKIFKTHVLETNHDNWLSVICKK